MKKYSIKEAAERLEHEVSGTLSAFEMELRQVIGNTNFACIQGRIRDLRAALAQEK